MNEPTVLIVPGLRGHVPAHWQTLLAARLPQALSAPPMGREDVDLGARVAALEKTARAAEGPLVVVAHSAGCMVAAHWALRTRRDVRGMLLATPPDLERPLPPGYPGLQALTAGGWLPVPRARLPFPSLVAASRDDPLGSLMRVTALAHDWGSRLVDLGAVGHLNPDAGFGEWPLALDLIAQLNTPAGAACA